MANKRKCVYLNGEGKIEEIPSRTCPVEQRAEQHEQENELG